MKYIATILVLSFPLLFITGEENHPQLVINNQITNAVRNVSQPFNMPFWFAVDEQQFPIKFYNPDSSVKFAMGDLATIPQDRHKYIRYISLYNIPKEKRKAYAQTVSFAVHCLSTRRKVTIPYFVGASDETLIRLDIEDYNWTSSVWEELAKKGSGPKAQPEPYFHAFVEKNAVGTKKVKKFVVKTKQVPFVDQTGKKAFKAQEVKEEIEVDEPINELVSQTWYHAPWVDQKAIQGLSTITGSDSPIVRGDWFIVNATLPPLYYKFLGIGENIKDFQKVIFADEQKSTDGNLQDKAVIVSSIVARNNRALIRSTSLTGYYWTTRDSLKSTSDRNYVKNFLRADFDATEDIGSLPNGLQAYFLGDGKGKRLDFADQNIAIDRTAVDTIVRTGRSCIVCHAEGIRPLEDEIRTLTKKLQNKAEIKLLILSKEDQKKTEDLFSYDIDSLVVKDQNRYAEAVALVNGMKSEANAKQYAEIYNHYVEELLTKETVVRDLGILPGDLERYAKASNDELVLGLLKQPIRPVRRDQWEISFQNMMILIMGANGNPVVFPQN